MLKSLSGDAAGRCPSKRNGKKGFAEASIAAAAKIQLQGAGREVMKTMIFLFTILGVAIQVEPGEGAIARCTVVAENGTRLTLDCPKKGGDFVSGETVKLKTEIRTKQTEEER
jgi:hypothetical protein